LAARGDVFGIVNNVGVARHEKIDEVDFEAFTTVMDLNLRPALSSQARRCSWMEVQVSGVSNVLLDHSSHRFQFLCTNCRDFSFEGGAPSFRIYYPGWSCFKAGYPVQLRKVKFAS
jgi:hypothetical protein